MRSFALKAVVTLVFAFLFLPIVFVVVTSFSASPMLTFPPTSFTTRWYTNIPRGFTSGLQTSLIVATATSIIATVLGTGIALALARSRRGAWQTFARSLSLAPLTVPHLVLGVGLFHASLLVWDVTGFSPAGTLVGLIFSHVAIAVPYVVRSVLAGHAHFDSAIEEAALNLGASSFEVMRRVTFPILLPGILSGGFFAFLVSFDEVPITIFMGGGDSATTLPIRILSAIEFNMDPDVMAVSSMIIFASLGLMVLIDRTLGLERFFGVGRA